MSTFSKVFKKAKHYLDPRTHVKALQSALKHQRQAFGRFRAFQRRAVSRDNIKDIGRNVARVETKFMPYVIGVAAGVLSFVFTPLLGAALTLISAPIARAQGATAARDKGYKGREARERGRDKRDQTILLGSIGTTAGALTSLAVAALSAPAVAAPAAEGGAVAAGAGAGASGAGAGVAPVQSAAELGLYATAEESAKAAVGFSALPAGAADPGAAVAAAEAARGGSSFLADAWNVVKGGAEIVGKAAPTILQFAQQLLKRPGGAVDPNATGGAGSGAEGTGDVGAEGDIFDDVAGLPLWVKLGAGGVGAGLVYVALRKKGRVAA